MSKTIKPQTKTPPKKEMERMENDTRVAKRNFEEVDQVCKLEMERFSKEMKLDLDVSSKSYVSCMSKLHESVSSSWTEFISQVDSS